MPKQEFSNCIYDTLYFDGEGDVGNDCKVVIEDGDIEVTYIDEDNRYTYRGNEIGAGHFKLNGVDFDGTATLHQFPEGRILEGYWVEDGYRGMWRIQLA